MSNRTSSKTRLRSTKGKGEKKDIEVNISVITLYNLSSWQLVFTGREVQFTSIGLENNKPKFYERAKIDRRRG